MNNINNPRGSIWRKWDMHVHSPASFSYVGTYDQFVTQIESADCSVIGINDYCSVEGYKQFISRSPNSKKIVFPVVEFRMTNVLLNKNSSNGQRLNFHIIFSNKIDVADIENFIKSLTVNGTKISSKYTDSKFLYEKVAVDFSSVLTSLKADTTFNGKYLVWVPYDEYGGIDNIDPVNDQWFKQGLINDADLIGSSNQKQIDFFLWKDEKFTEEQFVNWFKDKKPCLKGSDSHDHSYPIGLLKDTKSNPCDKSCWIKADMTFEGLKQVVNEPDDRIYIGKIPQKLLDIENHKSHYIETLSLRPTNPSQINPWFNSEIPINPELVAIIGKKGSGKSAKADSIAIGGKSHADPENYSFLRHDKFRKKGLAKQYKVTIKWCDGIAVTNNLNDSVNLLTEPEQVKYLPQKFVETICDESGISLFQQEIDKVIFSYVPEENRNETTNLKDLINLKTGLIDKNIDSITQKLNDQNEILCKLEDKKLPSYLESLKLKLAEKDRELKSLVEPIKVKEPKSKPSKEIEDNIATLNASLEAIDKEIIEKQQLLKTTNQHVTKLQNIEFALGSLESQLNEFQKTYKDDLALLKLDPQKLVSVKLDQDIIKTKKSELTSEKSKLETLLSDEGDGKTSLVVKRKAVIVALKTITDSLDKENNDYREYLKSLKIYKAKKESIEGSGETPQTPSIKSLTEEIDYVQNKLNAEIESVEGLRDSFTIEIYEELLKKISFYEEIYAPLAKVIKDKKDKQEKTGSILDFNAGIVFDKLAFPTDFLSFIDQGRDGSYQGKVEGLSRVREIIANSDLKTKVGIAKFLEDLMTSLRIDLSVNEKPPKLLDAQLIKSENNKQKLYNFLYGLKYLEVKYNITFNGKDLNENEFSPGEIGALLLIFYLLIDKEKIPLIIDQPEENLDNESVFTLLVPYIKQAKKERQIIIVTHNPNLAVVCDAEQIICAEMDKHTYQITYSSGSIENPITNKKIIDVLEGTLPAFKKRDKKYQKILF